ncbi:hypothetical protein SAMN02745150_00093 [Brevinema andersonii]|uniref:DUF2225 domain-containing protein n=1 Tax=Brevinema andersonii TaxID=34097 RepID=A0A1I1CYC9_BREAD|nr:DUF2225 domain-containing protein [Brevinema andersonii]SFB67685.1 hypothetical protein SAMN02745150_00093 [Brevinema andersonii]
MNEKVQRVTFFSKNLITCPACGTEFQREELQTGRGRINAGDLTDELRRLYIPTQKYGTVNPLIYPIVVCPECFFAGLPSDMQKMTEVQISKINKDKGNRLNLIRKIFGETLNFRDYRNVITGLGSYILAFMNTIHLPKEFSPTARRGLYTLRAAWLADDVYKKTNLDHFKKLRQEMYRQALINYENALERQMKNIEPFDGFVWMGPDVDTNFGYDGILYITAILTLKNLDLFISCEEQINKIGRAKIVLSKIFGIGKSNKEKPKALVSLSKNLYMTANNILKNFSDQGIDISAAETEEDQHENI